MEIFGSKSICLVFIPVLSSYVFIWISYVLSDVHIRFSSFPTILFYIVYHVPLLVCSLLIWSKLLTVYMTKKFDFGFI